MRSSLARWFRPEIARAAGFALLAAPAAAAQMTIHVPQDQPTIQAAIDAAHDGDTVLVSPGTYAVNLVYRGKAITVTSGATSYSSPATQATILTPEDPRQTLVLFFNQEGLGSVLNGFTLQGVVVDPFVVGAIETGTFEKPTIRNNRFLNDVSPVIMTGGEFAGNYVSQCTGSEYGVVYTLTSTTDPQPYMYTHDNLIENNTSDSSVFMGAGRVERNIIRNNSYMPPPSPNAAGDGIIDVLGAFTQNLVYGNRGSGVVHVGAQQTSSINTVVANNTFADNVPPAGCTGGCTMPQIILDKTAPFEGNTVLVANNIFQSTSPGPSIICPDNPARAPILPAMMDTLQVDHNLFSPTATLYGPSCRPQITSAGNILADPKFANAAAGDFHLTAGSPPVDAGNNSLIAQVAQLGGSLATDFDGNPRPVDATGLGYPVIDMGAYELAGLADGAPTSLLLTPSSYSPNITQTITFTAALSSSLGIPVGPVTFYEDGAAVATSNVKNDGTTTLQLPLNTAGPVEFLATYPGAYPYTPAQSTKLVLVVTLIPTYLTLTAAPGTADPGQPVTLHVTAGATDSSVPSPITLTVNGAPFTTLYPDASGNANLTTTALPGGTDTIVATYAGDQHHRPSTASTTVQVILNDFTITLTPPTVTVAAGQKIQTTVLLSSLGIFADSLQLSVANLPQYSSASLSSSSVQLSPGGTASAVLTISTSSLPLHASRQALPPPGAPAATMTLALLAAIPLALRRRRPFGALLTLVLTVGSLSGLAGCTDISYPLNKLAPGTYTLPVTATDPSTGTSHGANLTLLVTT